MTEKEKMVAGKFYNASDKTLIKARIRARILADKFNRSHAWNIWRRNLLIKKMFPNANGKNAFFEPSLKIEYGTNVQFGDNFYMNFDCQLLDVAPIKIGNNVMFGSRVTIATPCHPLVASERILQHYPDGEHTLEYAKSVEIGDNVWIASSVTICGGVRIGDNAVIAAGSVVTKDIPPNVLAGGVPCKIIREITDKDNMHPWECYLKNKY